MASARGRLGLRPSAGVAPVRLLRCGARSSGRCRRTSNTHSPRSPAARAGRSRLCRADSTLLRADDSRWFAAGRESRNRRLSLGIAATPERSSSPVCAISLSVPGKRSGAAGVRSVGRCSCRGAVRRSTAPSAAPSEIGGRDTAAATPNGSGITGSSISAGSGLRRRVAQRPDTGVMLIRRGDAADAGRAGTEPMGSPLGWTIRVPLGLWFRLP